MGCRLLGGGYRVSGIGIRMFWFSVSGSGQLEQVQHARRQMGRQILDNQILWYFDIFGNWVMGNGD